MIYYRCLFDNIFFHWQQKVSKYSSNNWAPSSLSGSVIQDYGSSDPKEIFTDPQQCCQAALYSK
jgi:hypothetical protein